MGVPRHDQVIAERGELRSRVRSVHHCQAEGIRRGARGHRQIGPVDVCVVEPDDLHLHAVHPPLVLPIAEVHPSVALQLSDQILGTPPPSGDPPPPAVRDEVPHRVDGSGCEQIVRPQHEQRCHSASDGPERGRGELHGLGLSEDVSGDHGHVGAGEGGQEAALALVAAHQMEVGEVKDGEPRGLPG